MTTPAPQSKGPILTRAYLETLAERCLLPRESGANGILQVGLQRGGFVWDSEDKVYRANFGFGPSCPPR